MSKSCASIGAADRLSTLLGALPLVALIAASFLAYLLFPAMFRGAGQGSPGTPSYSISVVRFRPGVKPKMAGGAEWAPERFDAAREASDYDYFIVKSSTERSRSLFAGPMPAAVLDRHFGDWWGYRRWVAASATGPEPLLPKWPQNVDKSSRGCGSLPGSAVQ